MQTLIFTVNSFSGEGFAGIPSAFSRLVDGAGASEIARFDLSLEGGNYTGLIMTKLYRHNSEWKLQAIGEHASGRTFHDPVSYTHLDVYKRQRLYWASACPCSAALRYSLTAFSSLANTPRPDAYIAPSANCAPV